MSFKFEVTGLDKLQKELENQVKKIEELGGNVPFVELFPETFMTTYTNFKNIQDFVDKSGFDFENMETINATELDNFVREHTSFPNWEEMKNQAAEIWVNKQLNF